MINQPKGNEWTSWTILITDLIFKLLNLIQINQQLNIIHYLVSSPALPSPLNYLLSHFLLDCPPLLLICAPGLTCLLGVKARATSSVCAFQVEVLSSLLLKLQTAKRNEREGQCANPTVEGITKSHTLQTSSTKVVALPLLPPPSFLVVALRAGRNGSANRCSSLLSDQIKCN